MPATHNAICVDPALLMDESATLQGAAAHE